MIVSRSRYAHEQGEDIMPSARWTMIVLCCLANTINYIDRANLAVAAPIMQRELGFDAATMGLVLGGFFWTYSFMQMPFGWFADRVGARISLALAVVWWSVFTALTAAARGVVTLMGCRLLLGVGEAGAYPSCAKVAANWFPRSERGSGRQHLRQRLAHRRRAFVAAGRLDHQHLRLADVVRRHRPARASSGRCSGSLSTAIRSSTGR